MVDVAGLVMIVMAGLALFAATALWVPGKITGGRFSWAILLCGIVASLGMLVVSPWSAVVLVIVTVAGAYVIRILDGAERQGRHSRGRMSQ